jgi:CPA1 family monovalent cation:H+ antiporter
MSVIELGAMLLVLAALYRYLNDRFLRLPPAIGVMTLALATSLALAAAGALFHQISDSARHMMRDIDLHESVLRGMLGYMLFAGALKTDLKDLARRRWTVMLLATAGVLISTAIVGFLTWGLTAAIGLGVRPIDCFIFGALISPTDPVAVVSILRRAGVPRETEAVMVGESLFNDGVGIVAFLGLISGATSPADASIARLIGFFVWAAIGGALFGLAAGWLAYRMLRTVDNYQVEILLTVALVAGGFALADRLNLSGAIAMAVAGLVIGNFARERAMSKTSLQNLDTVWELARRWIRPGTPCHTGMQAA